MVDRVNMRKDNGEFFASSRSHRYIVFITKGF